MRVTGGIFRGRKLQTISGKATRPTADKVRQAVFNILIHDIEGARILDIFAGSGALGIDALSRGARSAVFIESGRAQAGAIKANLQNLALKAEVLVTDYRAAFRTLSREHNKFDLIFADPPYDEVTPAEIIEAVQQYGLLSPDGLLIIEHKRGQAMESDKMRLLKKRRFGQTEVSFYAQKQS
jgi:16S rRNA (guanine966-N2)-methyltransferase